MDHPTLILIRGLPGGGKSYIAVALQQALGEAAAVILDPDKIDLQSKEYRALSQALTAEGVDQKFHPYRYLRAQAYAAIEAHQYIIWNQGFTNLDGFQKTVVNLQTYAADHGTTLPLLVVEVEIPQHVAKARVAAREQQGGHGVSEEAFVRFIADYRSFASEGYNTVTIQGENPVAASVATIQDALNELTSPL